MFGHTRRGEIINVIMLVTAIFAAIMVLVVILFKTQYERADLYLENTIERAYSKVLIAAPEGASAIEHAMADAGVIGFGYYTVNGEPRYLWGDSPHKELPFSFFENTNVPYFKESNVIGYDAELGIVECIRYFSPGATKEDFDTIPFDVLAGDQTNYVIYMSLMGSEYIATVRNLGVWSAIAMTIVAILYVVFLFILLQNIKFRDRLREQESLVALGQAARTLTHEIKNPLSAITLQAALLKRTAPDEIQEDLQVITNESERLSRLSSKIADFLRNPVGEKELINLESFVMSIIAITNKGIPFIVDSSASPESLIMFDPDRLRSVIENVIINAIQANDGSIEGMEVELSYSKREKSYALSIRDRGCGISPENMKKVFNPFFTTKVHGSGIGLSIARQFLKASGGSLSLEPRKDGGTEVTLYFKKNV